jgi:hypothetical protein
MGLMGMSALLLGWLLLNWTGSAILVADGLLVIVRSLVCCAPSPEPAAE